MVLFFQWLRPLKKNALDVNLIQYILASEKNVEKLTFELKKLCLENGIEKEHWQILQKEHSTKDRFNQKEVRLFKNLLQYALPFKLRKFAIDKLFLKYVKVSKKEFSKTLYLSENDLKFMFNEGMYIGNHSYSHSWLNNLTYKEQEYKSTNPYYF